jgi:hypothetical protein
MDKLLISLAYKHVAMAIMLAQANEFAHKTGLPLERPIAMADVQSESHVSPPRLMGFGGSIVTTNYGFGFSHGYLANFKKLERKISSDSALRARNSELATMVSDVDTNGAYHLATNWLTAIGVDVPAIESKYPHTVTQRFFYKNPGTTAIGRVDDNNKVALPTFDIEWGKQEVRSDSKSYAMPLMSVTVFGPTKELIEMHVLDAPRVGGVRQPIKDVEKLLAIPDQEFTGYDDLSKSNLVAQFSNSGPSAPENKPAPYRLNPKASPSQNPAGK